MDKQFGLIETKAVKDEENRVIEFIATSQIVDYDGDIVEIEGVDIKAIKKNKSFLWSHNKAELPIGKILSLKKVGKQIIGKAQLTSEEEYPFGYQIWKLIKNGYINNVSMSFLPNYDTMEYKEIKGKRVRVIKDATMIEISAVNMGANKNALITSKSLKDMSQKAWENGDLDGEELNLVNENIDSLSNEEKEVADVIKSDVKEEVDNKELDELKAKVIELTFLLEEKELEVEDDDIYSLLYDEYKDEIVQEDELTIDDLDNIL